MTPNANPIPWNRKRGKLSIFARGESDPEIAHNAAVVNDKEQAKQAEPLQAPGTSVTALNTTSGPSRAELANEARIPMDSMRKKILPSSVSVKTTHVSSNPVARNKQQQPLRPLPRISEGSTALSPHKRREVQAQQQEPQRDIFEGSQLGESFMRSGLTTPQNEPEEFVFQDVAPPKEEDAGELEEVRHSGHASMPPTRMRKNAEGRLRLYIGEDGRMTVNGADGRAGASWINDGFQNTAMGHDNHGMPSQRPASPARRPPKLPMREVKVPRPKHMKERYASKQLSPRRSLSPNHDELQWEGKMHRHRQRSGDTEEAMDMETVVLSMGADEDVQTTPKSKKTVEHPQSSAMESKLPPSLTLGKTKKRSHGGPDYDDMALSSMTFAELQNEPFDLDPAKASKVQSTSSDDDSLATKLDRVRLNGERDQREFFSTMSIEDWEASGDWFVEQFAGIMNKLKDARRQKREMVAGFEAEASKREEAVRLRSENIDRKLNKMKQDGHRVVNDKAG